MVFYFYTKYAESDIEYLVEKYPSYKKYNFEFPLKDTDTLIICIYLHLAALAEFCNLMGCLMQDQKKYAQTYKARFKSLNQNINSDNHKRYYIFHKDLGRLFERKNSKLFLYNSWETRDLYTARPVIIHYCKYHKIPTNKLILSMTDHQHMFKRCHYPRIISYDWQFIIAKKNFSRNSFVSNDNQKSKSIIFMNNRCNDERFCTAAYLFTYYREKCHISFLMNARSDKITAQLLRQSQQFLSTPQIQSFQNHIPLYLDTNHATKSYKDFLEDAYIMLIFETNIVRHGCQQISEKTYRPLLAGMPFILWSYQGGILSHLHRLGFKTFTPFIKEDYDDKNKSYLERYKLLIRELDRICSLNTRELEQLYKNCYPIIEHNIEVLESTTNLPPLL